MDTKLDENYNRILELVTKELTEKEVTPLVLNFILDCIKLSKYTIESSENGSINSNVISDNSKEPKSKSFFERLFGSSYK